MAVIKTKNNSNAVPAANALQTGELAVDVAQGRLWVGNADLASITEIVGGAIGGGTDDQTLRWNNGAWEANSALVVDDAGFVGIGTTNPTNRLQINRLSADTFVVPPDVNANTAVLVTPGSSTTTSGAIITVLGGTATGNSVGMRMGDSDSAGRAGMLYRPDQDALVFEAGGFAERMRIDSTGKVGIGTDAPNNPLEVVVGSGGRLAINSGVNGTDEKAGLQFYLRNIANVPTDVGSIDVGRVGTDASNFFMAFNGLAGAERMRIDSDGNVGIGTNDPISKLDIRQTAGSNALNIGNSTGTGYVQIRQQTGETEPLLFLNSRSEADIWKRGLSMGVNNTVMGSIVCPVLDEMWFYTGTTERMRITSTGNVGIGTGDPQAKLEIETPSTTNQFRIQQTGTNQCFALANIGTTGGNFSVNRTGGAASTAAIHYEGNGAYFRSTTNSADWVVGQRNGSGGAYNWVAGGNERMQIDASGNLLVGTTGIGIATTGLDVIPNGTSSWYSQTGPWLQGRINNSGGNQIKFFVGGTESGSITTTSGGTPSFSAGASDERLKENVVEHEPTLAQVMALRPVRFDWKDGSGEGEGFIAQEVQEVWPDCVMDRGDEYLTTTGFDAVTTRLVKAIQEQQSMITELTTRLEQGGL